MLLLRLLKEHLNHLSIMEMLLLFIMCVIRLSNLKWHFKMYCPFVKSVSLYYYWELMLLPHAG